MTAARPLYGHGTAEARFLGARASGRLHHGWIVEGPSGIGKAVFVQRLAAVLLGAAAPDAPDTDPVMQKVLSGAHPDLKWLRREVGERDQLRQNVTVQQVRDLTGFFGLRPALGGWRVGVLDSLDETHLAGQNALLKTLEEPPRNALLFLINHGTMPVLPTIRSRCQTLRLSRLGPEDTQAVLHLAGAGEDDLSLLARGRPGYALDLKETGGVAAARAADALLKTIERPAPTLVAHTLLAASRDAGALAAFGDVLLDWIAVRAPDQPGWGKVWLDIHAVRAEAAALALTPLQTATKMLAILQDGAKSLLSAD